MGRRPFLALVLVACCLVGGCSALDTDDRSADSRPTPAPVPTDPPRPTTATLDDRGLTIDVRNRPATVRVVEFVLVADPPAPVEVTFANGTTDRRTLPADGTWLRGAVAAGDVVDLRSLDADARTVVVRMSPDAFSTVRTSPPAPNGMLVVVRRDGIEGPVVATGASRCAAGERLVDLRVDVGTDGGLGLDGRCVAA